MQVAADEQPGRGQNQPGDAEQDQAPAQRADPGPVSDREHRRGDHDQHHAGRQQQPGRGSRGHLRPPGLRCRRSARRVSPASGQAPVAAHRAELAAGRIRRTPGLTAHLAGQAVAARLSARIRAQSPSGRLPPQLHQLVEQGRPAADQPDPGGVEAAELAVDPPQLCHLHAGQPDAAALAVRLGWPGWAAASRAAGRRNWMRTDSCAHAVHAAVRCRLPVPLNYSLPARCYLIRPE